MKSLRLVHGPKRKPGQRKSKMLFIPVTAGQHKAIFQFAESQGQDMATMARSLLIREATKTEAT